MLQVKVSKSQVSRGMIILDAFIKLIKKRGHKITLRSDKSYVVIAGEEIGFSLREKTKREQDPKSTYSYTIAKPLGILILKMWSYHDKEWQDGTVKLDHQLESIMLRMEEEARYLAAFHEQARKHHEEFIEKERQKQAIAEREKKELEDFKAMLAKSKRWGEAVILRNYIQEVERQNVGTNRMDQEKLEWIKWAKAKADWYDPFIEREDEWLKDFDPKFLESSVRHS
jgi:hypothetical protein